MNANFTYLESPEQFESLIERSYASPVVVFKHSNSCGTSFDVLEQIEEIDENIYILIVQTHRDLSNRIAEFTGHRHHSPQAFVFRDGKVVYHATHYGINPSSIKQTLNEQ